MKKVISIIPKLVAYFLVVSLFLQSCNSPTEPSRGLEKSTSNVITQLSRKLKEDTKLARLIEVSIQQARSLAQQELEPKTYKALIWPENVEDYIDYLDKFARHIPKPSQEDTKTKQVDESHNMLSQFYWLINQQVEGGNTLQDHEWFSAWVDRYARCWGDFLDSPESFNQDLLDAYIKDMPKYRVEDSMIEDEQTKTKKPNLASGWLTYNQFFTRSLNPGLRPIDSPMDNSVVTSPADCFYRAQYPIAADSSIPEVRIKKTHNYASIEQLLKGSRYKSEFAGGTFVHFYLAPYSYHRLHFPVSGILEESYTLRGTAYANPNIVNHEFSEPDEAKGGYEFSQTRGILTIDTTHSPFGNVGIIAVIPVGMSQVSSVNLIAQPSNTFLKGDEFGYFAYGGSDIIVLFQKGVNPQIDERSEYRHYGTRIALCTRK